MEIIYKKNMKINKKNLIFIIIGALIMAIGIISYSFADGDNIIRNGNHSYEFVVVQKGVVEQVVTADGSVVADSEIELKYQIGGRLAQINYEVGQKIKKDYILAELDSRDQEIRVKQHQASLSQARANLNLKLAGVSGEDIQVYQTAVYNAETNLIKTKESVNKDIANVEAQINTSETALENVLQGLEDAQSQANSSIDNALGDALRVMDSALLTAQNSLDCVKDTVNDDDLEDVLSVKDSQYKVQTSSNYNQAIMGYGLAVDNVAAAKAEPNEANINIALTQLKNNLAQIYNTLDSLYNALYATITCIDLSQADLDIFKATISTSRSNVNTSLTSVNTEIQAISSIKVTNQTNINTAKALIDTAQSGIDSAEANLIAVQAKADTRISLSESALQIAQDKLILIQAKPREVDIASLNALVRQAWASLELSKEELKKTKLVALSDGIITKIDGEIGENISAANTFITMISSQIQIEANVPEIDIAKVKINNPVKITLDAYGDRIFSGKIISIEPAETVVQGVIYYQIKVVFDEDAENITDVNIMPGMTADLDVLTAKKDNVLILPIGSVKEGGDGKRYVQVYKNGKNGKIFELEIETGLNGKENIEIIKGLNENDKVISFD